MIGWMWSLSRISQNGPFTLMEWIVKSVIAVLTKQCFLFFICIFEHMMNSTLVPFVLALNSGEISVMHLVDSLLIIIIIIIILYFNIILYYYTIILSCVITVLFAYVSHFVLILFNAILNELEILVTEKKKSIVILGCLRELKRRYSGFYSWNLTLYESWSLWITYARADCLS